MQLLTHRAFLAGMVLKGLDGILELGGGVALIFTSKPAIRHLVVLLTHAELIEDPHDFFANQLIAISERVSIHTQHFAGTYLLAHGLIKLGLAIGLLRRVSWSYPAGLLFLTAFILYQIYRTVHAPSLTLALLTVVDLVIVVLIWHEWKQAKAHPAASLQDDRGR